jgi:hypothetical protein
MYKLCGLWLVVFGAGWAVNLLCKKIYVVEGGPKRIKYSYKKTNMFANVKVVFSHIIHQNSDTFRYILIIFRKLLNVRKAYIKT